MSLLLIILVLILVFGGGGLGYNGGAYRNYGFGIGGVLLILLVVFLLTGVIHLGGSAASGL